MRRRVLAVLAGVAVVLTAALAVVGAQEVQPGGAFFDDNGTTHEPNIEAIAAKGITGGCVSEGTAYCPDLSVTRAQMASFMARALGLAGGTPTFQDVEPTDTHATNIDAIARAGITLGCNSEGTLYCPNDFVTRDQMASFLARGLGLSPRATGPFTDVSGTHAGNINAIAAAGITLGCNSEGTLYCPDREVTRAQMASFLARGLELEPINIPPRIPLTGMAGACSGATPVCSFTLSLPASAEYFIQEGWFYTLPYEPGDQSALASDGTYVSVTIDGEPVGDLTPVPTTDYFGTIIKIGGAVLDDLGAGTHEIDSVWYWDGEAVYETSVTVNIG